MIYGLLYFISFIIIIASINECEQQKMVQYFTYLQFN